MANPHRGEVSFEADGATYTLRYSANSLCELEESLGRGVIEITRELASWKDSPEKIRFGLIRAVFWAGLREHHPELDLKAAGELILAAGGAVEAMVKIGEAFGQAFPSPQNDGAGQVGEMKVSRPLKPRRNRHGIGPPF